MSEAAQRNVVDDALLDSLHLESHRLSEGKLVLMEAIGGGLSWGAVLARW